MPIKFRFPSITCAMLRPQEWMKKNELVFEFPRFVNKVDIKNYLQSMYGVNVLKVSTVVPPRTRIRHPKPHLFHKHPSQTPWMWLAMKKKAYVTIDSPFEYPPVHDRVKTQKEMMEKRKREDEKKRIEQIKVFRDDWDKVVDERYMGLPKLQDEPCLKMEHPLGKLELDDLVIVKGQAKKRVHLDSRGRPRREGKVYSEAVSAHP